MISVPEQVAIESQTYSIKMNSADGGLQEENKTLAYEAARHQAHKSLSHIPEAKVSNEVSRKLSYSAIAPSIGQNLPAAAQSNGYEQNASLAASFDRQESMERSVPHDSTQSPLAIKSVHMMTGGPKQMKFEPLRSSKQEKSASRSGSRASSSFKQIIKPTKIPTIEGVEADIYRSDERLFSLNSPG